MSEPGTSAGRTRTVILGAAGRDFHNFNVAYRDDPATEVVAFTATQIPGIDDRRYLAALAGPLYPEGIPIVPEDELEDLCQREGITRVVFAYSDVPHEYVMHLASRALAVGADFELLGPSRTMLKSRVPVVAVSAMRTGSGKSQIARWLAGWLASRGAKVAAVRHPMPYGNLAAQRVQRFATLADLDSARCTTEEREEYEPHIEQGAVVFAGVDYAAILSAAEAETDVLVWDGGNNDFPFLRPNLHIGVADALRPTQLTAYHPGEAVMRMADVLVINKVDAAPEADIAGIEQQLHALNPGAPVVRAASPVLLDDPGAVRGRRVIVVEDGPTITHGGMPYGAGYVAAEREGAKILDPRDSAPASLRAVYDQYPHIGRVLPDLGYSPDQLAAVRETIESSEAEAVVVGSPVDLDRLLDLSLPVVRARYRYAPAGAPTLDDIVDQWYGNLGTPARDSSTAAR